MIITAEERKKLWSQYPEVQELFEEFNSTLLEDDQEWERLVKRCYGIRERYYKSKVVEMLLVDAAHELENIAKKRRYG